MPIKILSPLVANRIAAGEVVERPASVIKELVENSLDAGATDIRVEIREGGRRLMRVQDNGCGIPEADTHLAFKRHATSKIASADDLNHITTLGFRGEALASIASVAQVTLLTRAASEEVGTLVRMADGKEIARQPQGGPVGTTVTVEHLFANVPARLKFLKRAATEAGHISKIVSRYALAYPACRFSLVNEGRLIFQSTGSGKLYDVIVKLYGLEMAQQMLAVGEANLGSADGSPGTASSRAGHAGAGSPPIRVSGYVGAPALHRSNRSYISLFINRRWFQDSSIAYSVIQAYHTMLPAGRYPIALVFIQMPPEDVDVNVHPTKAEVRFRDSRAVFREVQRAVRETLTGHAPIPQIGLGGTSPRSQVGPGSGDPMSRPWSPPGVPSWQQRREALLDAGRGRQLPLRTGPSSPEQPAQGEAGGDRPSTSGASTAGPLQPGQRPRLIPLLRVVGQLGATYIVAEGPDGMYLIDQHAAHERILYEKMLAEHAAQTLAVQRLLEPLVLNLSPEQAAVVADELETLNDLGVDIEPFGGDSYLVRAVPAVLSQDDPQAALIAIIDGLADRTDLVAATGEERLVATICKRAAVKGGQPLSPAEMQELVRRLEGCRAPRTCPHGRPTMIYLSTADLARQFGRV